MFEVGIRSWKFDIDKFEVGSLELDVWSWTSKLKVSSWKCTIEHVKLNVWILMFEVEIWSGSLKLKVWSLKVWTHFRAHKQ